MGCVAVTQSVLMRRAGAGLLLLCSFAGGQARAADDQDEPVAVAAEHPIFLSAARLRLLKRERERGSERWRQFESLVKSGGTLEEPGFALALYYQVSGDAAAGRRAVEFALDPARNARADLRQLALVFDWCRDLMSEAQRRELAGRAARGMADLDAVQSVPAASARTLAAIALYEDLPDAPQAELNRTVHTWWEARMAPAIDAGEEALPREDALALFELLHALRDASGIDLRRSCPRYFVNLPIERLMSYYPGIGHGVAGDFRMGATFTGVPDAHLAEVSRAADLAAAAYDPDLPESETLQGWLMHDPFAMRDSFGAPYEFLWANPYQPGLSYYHVPLAYYAEGFGKLFVRSSWDDSATWLGLWGGAVQKFVDGRAAALDPAPGATERFDAAVVRFGPSPQGFTVNLKEGQRLFIARLGPGRSYHVKMGDLKPFDARADAGGILELKPAAGEAVQVSVR